MNYLSDNLRVNDFSRQAYLPVSRRKPDFQSVYLQLTTPTCVSYGTSRIFVPSLLKTE